MQNVSLELFKRLYELGFKMKRVQEFNDKPIITFSSLLYEDGYTTVLKKEKECVAYYIPTTTEVIEFLYEKYKLFINIKIKIADPFHLCSDRTVFIYSIYRIKHGRDSDEIILLDKESDDIKKGFIYRCDAEESAITYCLNNLI